MIIIIICVRRSKRRRRQRWSQLHIKPDSKRTDLVSIGRLLALAAPPQMHMPSNNSSMLATTATTTMNMPFSLWLWLFLAHDKYQINILLMGGLFSGVIFFLCLSHASFVRRHDAKGSWWIILCHLRIVHILHFPFSFWPLSLLLSSSSKLVSTTAVGPLSLDRTKYSVKSCGTHYEKWHATTDGVATVSPCSCMFVFKCAWRSPDSCPEAWKRLNCVELRVAYSIRRCIIGY